MAIVEEYKIETGSDVEQSLRKIITNWANKIPFHPYKNLGDKIKVTSIIYSPIYLLDCWTQFYSVEDTARERNYGEGLKYNGGKTFVPHNFKRDSFVKHIERYCLPGSESVHACNNCNGSGKCNCNKCSGKGAVNCHGCGGSGNCLQCGGNGRRRCSSCNGGMKPCSTCNGSGGINHYDNYSKSYVFKPCLSCGGSRTERCQACSGKGYLNCWGCMGSGHCGTCSGRKTLTCTDCHGSGKILCSKCSGYGKIIKYIERAEKWDYCNKYDYVVSPSIKNDFDNVPVKEKPSMEFLCDKYAEVLTADLYAAEPQHLQITYKNLLQQSSIPTFLDVKADAKILEQYSRAQRIPAHYVQYSFEGNNFGLVVFPKDEDVFEEDGPINRYRKELIQNAHGHLKRKNYGKSADFADQAVKMGLDTKDPLLEKIHKKVNVKIKAIYKIGAFFGAWITAYFVSLGIINYLSSPKYFLNIINEKVAGWGSNFLLINNVFLVLLIVIISLLKSVQLAGKKMVPFPGRIMKPEAMRFATGLVTGVFYTLLVSVVFLFLNYAGILLIATKIIYYLVGLIFSRIAI